MTALGNVSAIVAKEWRHYFGSPIAWVALFVWTMLFGIFYYFMFTFFLQQSMMGQGAGFGSQPMSLNEMVIAPVLQNMAVVALFLAPMLTMRLFAEEKRQGTLELLATSPLTNLQIVLGKFLAAAGLYALMILAGLLNIALLWYYASSSPPEWKPIATGCLALLLMGSCFLALGTFVSTLTRNQIVAGILSFCLFLGIWTLGWADEPAASDLVKVIAYLGITTHMEDLLKGVLDLKDVVFYLSFIGFGLFLAHQSIESQRWRA
jgi:ABC-2 type transport system permease protein